MTEQLTAREQFARDIALVLDNDRASYELITASAKRLNNAHKLGEVIRAYVEAKIEQAIGTEALGALLIRQICYNWGTEPFTDYAREIMERINESARY